MGRKYSCDFCPAEIALESALIPIKVGEKVVGEACFNCAANWEQGINTAKMENVQTKEEKSPAGQAAPTEPPKPNVQVQPGHEPTEAVQGTGAAAPAAAPSAPK